MRLSRSRILVGVTVGWTILVAAIWVRSYFRRDVLLRVSETRTLTYTSTTGGNVLVLQIRFPHESRRDTIERPFSWESQSTTQPTPLAPVDLTDERFSAFGVGYYRGNWGQGWVMPYWAVVVPLWPLLLPPVAVLTWKIVQVQRGQRRRRAGLCVACGYDLRASPARCPECGRACGDGGDPRRAGCAGRGSW